MLSVPLNQTWPLLFVTMTLVGSFLFWLITVDRWKAKSLNNQSQAGNGSTINGTDSLSAHQFAVRIDAQPLFEGQTLEGRRQAVSGIQCLQFLLESNCPEGCQIFWQPNSQLLLLLFPVSANSHLDPKEWHVRIQSLIEHWVEMFKISLSATSLKVTLGHKHEINGATLQGLFELKHFLFEGPGETGAREPFVANLSH
jgi:hypothetical protein